MISWNGMTLKAKSNSALASIYKRNIAMTARKPTFSIVVKKCFEASTPLNDICTEVVKMYITNGTEFDFNKINPMVKNWGSENGFIIDEKALTEKVSAIIADKENLPSTYVDLVKLTEKLSNQFYKDAGKILDCFKINWEEANFPVDYKLSSDWTDTIENQVLFEIFKSESGQSIEQLMQECRKHLMTKETESTPASHLTEKRADQYTRKVLKWFVLFQKIVEKHGIEINNFYK